MLLFEHALIAKFSNNDPDDKTQKIPPWAEIGSLSIFRLPDTNKKQ